MVQKQSTPDKKVNDPMKDPSASAGQGQQSGNQQSGQQQQGMQQSGQRQQGSQQSGQQSGQQQQGSQQSGRQGNQQSGGQHASGGTPALDDLEGRKQGESAQQASEAFNQQNKQRDKR